MSETVSNQSGTSFGGTDSKSSKPNDIEANGGAEDDNISGFEFMKKYYTCTKAYRRQQIAKNMMEIFGTEMGNRANEDEFFVVFDALVNDKDVIVRTDIIEQAGKLAAVLFTMSMSEHFSHYSDYISRHILTSIYSKLSDTAQQVRKASSVALISLVENKILNDEQIVDEVLSLITAILDHDDASDELRTEAVSLLVRLACLCGRKLTIQYFVHRIVALCRDQVFSVRKTCALSLPDIINIVGPEVTEKLLLPELKYLANDSVWGVRKISAESFTAFSENVSHRTRCEVLSPMYLKFLQDNSRWVKIAAFQNLGKFIATFADVTQSGVSLAAPSDFNAADNPEVVLHPNILSKLKRLNEDTSLQLRWATNVFWSVPPAQIAEFDLEEEASEKIGFESSKSNSPNSNDKDVSLTMVGDMEEAGKDSQNNSADSGYASSFVTPFENNNSLTTTNTSSILNKNCLNEENPNINITGTITPVVSENQSSDDLDSVYTTRVAAPSSLGDEMTEENELTGEEHHSGGLDAAAEEQINRQTCIPRDLLLQFVSMCDPRISQNVDPELAKYCAYSIPAITFTLGRQNWACLRVAYAELAKDLSWKVRRSLAFSIHVMALMLGPEIMMSDLVPVFDSFLNDLDDVKAGILRHFSDFIRLLPTGQSREGYLSRLSQFIKPDNVRNWRFREDLACQLTQLCQLYSSESVKRYIVPLTISLCSDRVAQVRQCSFLLVATIIAKLDQENAIETAAHFRNLILDRFAKCTMFFGRLTFVQMCEVTMSQSNIRVSMFCKEYLPSLLALHADPVVNIRIALSRTLNSLYQVRPEFIDYKPAESEWTIEDAIQILAHDADRDVRSYCSKNTALFGSNVSFLNNSEDFDTTQITSSTFVLSQSSTAEENVAALDDQSTGVEQQQNANLSGNVFEDFNATAPPPPPPLASNNITRNLQMVLNEVCSNSQAKSDESSTDATETSHFVKSNVDQTQKREKLDAVGSSLTEVSSNEATFRSSLGDDDVFEEQKDGKVATVAGELGNSQSDMLNFTSGDFNHSTALSDFSGGSDCTVSSIQNSDESGANITGIENAVFDLSIKDATGTAANQEPSSDFPSEGVSTESVYPTDASSIQIDASTSLEMRGDESPNQTSTSSC